MTRKKNTQIYLIPQSKPYYFLWFGHRFLSSIIMRIQALFSPVIAFFKSRVSKNPKREKVISINNETFECLICMERKPIKTIFKPINKSSKKRKPNPKISCYHPFCVDCISKYIDAKVQDNISTIICPDVGCKKVIDFNCCVTIIPKPVLDRFV